MKPEEKARIFDEGLAKLYPDAECSLEYKGDPWRLLVMARLSAQCTDERVNAVCRELFGRFPDARSMADAPLEEIEELGPPLRTVSLEGFVDKSIVAEAYRRIRRSYPARH